MAESRSKCNIYKKKVVGISNILWYKGEKYTIFFCSQLALY